MTNYSSSCLGAFMVLGFLVCVLVCVREKETERQRETEEATVCVLAYVHLCVCVCVRVCVLFRGNGLDDAVELCPGLIAVGGCVVCVLVCVCVCVCLKRAN